MNSKQSDVDYSIGFLHSLMKLLCLSTAVLPLVYIPGTLYPFILSKTFLFFAITEIVVLCLITRLLFQPGFTVRISPFMKILLLYGLFIILLTFISPNPGNSFWSSHERMMGTLTLVHLFAFFLVLSNMFTQESDWRRLFIVSAVTTILVVLIGVVQYFVQWPFPLEKGDRVFSSLGNSIYLGGYGVLSALLSLVALNREKGQSLVWKLFWITAIVSGFVAVLLSGSRGSLLAVGSSIVIILLLALIYKPHQLKPLSIRVTGSLIGGLMILLIISQFIPLPILPDLPDFSLSATTARTRILNWHTAFRAWQAKPLLGWGPGNYAVAFNAYYNPDFFLYGESETWQDHAHNIFLEKGVETGIPGLAFFVILFLAAVYFTAKGIRQDHTYFYSRCFLITLNISFLVYTFFLFETLVPLVMLVYAWGYGQTLQARSKKRADASDLVIRSVAMPMVFKILIVSAITGLLIIWINHSLLVPYKASSATLQASNLAEMDPQQALGNLKLHLKTQSPYRVETQAEFVSIVTSALQPGSHVPVGKYGSLLRQAEEALENIVEENPQSIYYWLFLGRWRLSMAEIFKTKRYLEEAEEAFLQARNLSPRRQQVSYSLARTAQIGGKYNKALDELNRALALQPDVGETHVQIALVHASFKKFHHAYETLNKARKLQPQITNIPQLRTAAKVFAMFNDADGLDWVASMVEKAGFGLQEKEFFDRLYAQIKRDKSQAG